MGGTSVSLELSDGFWLNYYQNVAISLSNTPLNAQSKIMNDAGMAGQLLSNRSPLSESSQIGLMQSLVNKGKQDFLDYPIIQATMNTLAFVATGGVEGAMALGNIGKSLIGNIKIPVYRVYGGKASIYGKSYSLINPKYVPDYRHLAGLPDVNSGHYLLRGSISLKNINVGRWFAAPLDGRVGGLPFELYQNYNQLTNPVNIILKKTF